MNDWSAGYITGTDYTFGHYPELNPRRARLAFLFNGLAPPRAASACELGFGQGVSINLHAAASCVQWHGTDINSAQVAGARDMAEAAGSEVRLSDESFADFAGRTDLPGFDFIGLHGIWSWVSDENRRVLVDFIARQLKPGGVLYISYNTAPGWAAFGPMRHLMAEHARTLGAAGDDVMARSDQAIRFAERLLDTNPLYLRANPGVAERMKGLREQSRRYLTHEYFNQHWDPMPFSEIADWLAPARLDFACSANLLGSMDALQLTSEQQQLLSELPDPVFRETVRDVLLNQQFRRDYWVRGARRLNGLQRAEALRAERVVLVTHRPDVELTAKVAQGEATMEPAVYNPLLDALADHAPRTLGELEQEVRDAGVTFAQLVQAVVVLSALGHLHAVQDETARQLAAESTEALNRHLLARARTGDDIAYLASPVTGGGIRVSHFHQLFLLARSEGHNTPEEQARRAWTLLAARQQRLVKDGQDLHAEDDNIRELTRQAEAFAEQRLPVLRVLGVAD